jgi:hypothetical protein
VEGCSDKRVYKRIGIGSVVGDLAPAAADLLVLVDWLAVVQFGESINKLFIIITRMPAETPA